MARWQELLGLIRRGASPARITRTLGVAPSRLRRMLAGKRLRARLRLEQRLAAVTAAHGIAAGAHRYAARLTALMDEGNAETARKCAAALLSEGLQGAGAAEDASPRGEESKTGTGSGA